MTHLFSSNVGIINYDGHQVNVANPFPVTLGSDTINIVGNITVPTTVNVASSPSDPIHAHITEVGTSGNLLAANIPYMPVGGNVTALQGTIPWQISGNTSPNGANNPIYIAGNVATIGGSNQGKLWYFQVAQGSIPGTIPLFKAGYNSSVANNSEESLWDGSDLYPWSAWNTPGTLSCVSSGADTGTMTIVGLRITDFVQITETVTMSDGTPVVTANSFARINSLHYNGATANAGDITVSRNGTVVGKITAGFGQSQMAQYTVPAGYTAYMLTGTSNIGKGNNGIGKFKYRPYGGSMQTAMVFLLFQSSFSYEFQAPLVLPEKTDIDVTLTATNAGTAATCAYSLILIAN